MAFNGILYRKAGGTLELNRSVGGFCAVESAKLDDTWQEGGVVTLVVVTTEILTFYSGDYIIAKGNHYIVSKTVSEYVSLGEGKHKYTIPLTSPDALFKNALMYNTVEHDDGGVYTWTRPNNFIMELGSIEVLVKTCCYNINEVMNRRVFKLGTISEDVPTDYRVVNFSDKNCWAALKQSCETFETFYTIRVNTDETPDSDYIVDIGVEPGTFPETLMVGKRQGIAELTMSSQDEDVYTQFVVLGSTENLPAGYEHERLQLDTDLAGTPPVYDGSLIVVPEKYARWGRRRMELVFDYIKPSRTGTITGVPVDNIFAFYDTSLTDIIAVEPNWTPVGGTVHILDGNLMGYTFEIIGFHSGTQKITIKQISDSNGYVLPNDESETFRFAEGMKYNFAGIALPASYVSDAKSELKAAAVDAIDEYWSNPRGTFSLTPDPFFLRDSETELSCGWLIPIKHDALEIDKNIRVTKVTYDLLRDTYFDIDSVEVADITDKDNFINSVHKSTQRSLNMLREQGIINSPTARESNLITLLNRIALSLNLPDWGTLSEMLGNDKGLFTMVNEEGEDIHIVNVDLLRAGTALVDSLLTNEIFIGGVQDATEGLVNNFILHLTSSVATVSCDSEGTVTGTLPTSTAIVYHGASADTGWSFSGELSGCTGSVNEGTGVITITGLTADDSTVTVSATKTDKPTLQAIFRISKVYAGIDGIDGEDGVDSVIYYITPSVDNVVKSMSGTLTPSSVTCAQYKVVGNAAPVAGDKTIKYKLSGGALTTYTEAVNIGAASYVDFFLYDGEVELWRTRVPVILDASDIEYIYDSFADGNTYVAGGLVLSSFIGVLDGTDAVVAGMAGKDFVLDGETPITSPMLFAGATTAQNANNAKFRVYQDGGLYAELGKIGGLTIAADKLYLGVGNYANADTPFYVEGTEAYKRFSLGNKFSFDGTDLTINGGGTFTGKISVGGVLIGKDAFGSGLHGIKLNAYNYWYLDGANAKVKFGGETNYISWDGTSLTQNGAAIGGGSIVGTSIDIPNATTPLFKVTSAGVVTAKSGTIGGVSFTDTKLYLGTGTYGNSNTGFYVDTSAKFSLKDKLKFDGTNLTINGGGTFEGLLDVGGIKIGLNAISAGVDGLYIDDNNYWDETGALKIGGANSYLSYSGGNLSMFGGAFSASDGTTTVSISNSAYSSKAGVVVSGSSGSVSMGFFDSVSAPALVASDGTLVTGLSASGVIGWGGGSFSLGSGKYTAGETLLELQGAGSNYFSISSKSSGNAIISSGEFSITKNELYISALPTSTQTGGHFWSDSKGHVMVGAASAYTAADVGAVPTTRTVNSKALSSDITLSASDVGAVPTTRKVNSKALSADITLSASDVGAVPTTDIQYFTQAAWNALNSTQKEAIKLAIVY